MIYSHMLASMPKMMHNSNPKEKMT